MATIPRGCAPSCSSANGGSGPPVYSDINFILLGIAIERITGAPLSDWPLAAGPELTARRPGPPSRPSLPLARAGDEGRGA